jgi:pimeloyl-ACP methyl ester carboxylesterase
MKKWIGRIALGILVLLVVAAGAFVWWGNHPLEAMPEAVAALQSNSSVAVNSGDWIVFSPQENSVQAGIILYPGGHVDPRAYAPLAGDLAAEDYLVVIPPMPLNLAVLDIDVADEIMQAYPEIDKWVIGGHSLGGAMAAEYLSSNPSSIEGLFLWASYSAESTDLSDFTDLEVLSIFGTEDGDVEGIRASRERLPQNTLWVEIEGGNHAQFGWYGEQGGDGVATISRDVQQQIILENTIEFLAAIDE